LADFGVVAVAAAVVEGTLAKSVWTTSRTTATRSLLEDGRTLARTRRVDASKVWDTFVPSVDIVADKDATMSLGSLRSAVVSEGATDSAGSFWTICKMA